MAGTYTPSYFMCGLIYSRNHRIWPVYLQYVNYILPRCHSEAFCSSFKRCVSQADPLKRLDQSEQ